MASASSSSKQNITTKIEYKKGKYQINLMGKILAGHWFDFVHEIRPNRGRIDGKVSGENMAQENPWLPSQPTLPASGHTNSIMYSQAVNSSTRKIGQAVSEKKREYQTEYWINNCFQTMDLKTQNWFQSCPRVSYESTHKKLIIKITWLLKTQLIV